MSLTSSLLSDDELVLVGKELGCGGKLFEMVAKGRFSFSSSPDFETPPSEFLRLKLLRLESDGLLVFDPLLIDILVITEPVAGDDDAKKTDEVNFGVATVEAIVVKRLKAC